MASMNPFDESDSKLVINDDPKSGTNRSLNDVYATDKSKGLIDDTKHDKVSNDNLDSKAVSDNSYNYNDDKEYDDDTVEIGSSNTRSDNTSLFSSEHGFKTFGDPGYIPNNDENRFRRNLALLEEDDDFYLGSRRSYREPASQRNSSSSVFRGPTGPSVIGDTSLRDFVDSVVMRTSKDEIHDISDRVSDRNADFMRRDVEDDDFILGGVYCGKGSGGIEDADGTTELQSVGGLLPHSTGVYNEYIGDVANNKDDDNDHCHHSSDADTDADDEANDNTCGVTLAYQKGRKKRGKHRGWYNEGVVSRGIQTIKQSSSSSPSSSSPCQGLHRQTSPRPSWIDEDADDKPACSTQRIHLVDYSTPLTKQEIVSIMACLLKSINDIVYDDDLLAVGTAERCDVEGQTGNDAERHLINEGEQCERHTSCLIYQLDSIGSSEEEDVSERVRRLRDIKCLLDDRFNTVFNQQNSNSHTTLLVLYLTVQKLLKLLEGAELRRLKILSSPGGDSRMDARLDIISRWLQDLLPRCATVHSDLVQRLGRCLTEKCDDLEFVLRDESQLVDRMISQLNNSPSVATCEDICADVQLLELSLDHCNKTFDSIQLLNELLPLGEDGGEHRSERIERLVHELCALTNTRLPQLRDRLKLLGYNPALFHKAASLETAEDAAKAPDDEDYNAGSFIAAAVNSKFTARTVTSSSATARAAASPPENPLSQGGAVPGLSTSGCGTDPQAAAAAGAAVDTVDNYPKKSGKPGAVGSAVTWTEESYGDSHPIIRSRPTKKKATVAGVKRLEKSSSYDCCALFKLLLLLLVLCLLLLAALYMFTIFSRIPPQHAPIHLKLIHSSPSPM